jgi:hypothetical protein
MARKFGGLLAYGSLNCNLQFADQGTTAGLYAWVNNGGTLGDWSLNNTAGAATKAIACGLADVKRPFFTFQYPGISAVQPVSNEFQEVFGTAAGGPSNPFSGGATTPQFEVPPLPWGIAIVDVFAIYSVQTAALSTCTLACNRATYTENVAFTNTALIAATTIALTTTASATACHVQKVSATNPLVFEINDTSDVIVTITIGAAATSAVRLYALGAHVAVCYD